MKLVRISIRDKIHTLTRRKTYEQVENQLYGEILTQVRRLFRSGIRNQVYDQMSIKTK